MNHVFISNKGFSNGFDSKVERNIFKINVNSPGPG
jgi:hypothetical protein